MMMIMMMMMMKEATPFFVRLIVKRSKMMNEKCFKTCTTHKLTHIFTRSQKPAAKQEIITLSDHTHTQHECNAHKANKTYTHNTHTHVHTT